MTGSTVGELLDPKTISNIRPQFKRSTVYRLVKAGLLRHVRVGGKIYIPSDALDEFLANGGERGPGKYGGLDVDR